MGLNRLFRNILTGKGLDLIDLIKKIEACHGKDLKFSMREFRQLELIREDIVKLEGILNHPSKDQAILLDHYKKHSQDIGKSSERIERRMNNWIKKLERLITEEESNISKKDRVYFESWINKIDICKNT